MGEPASGRELAEHDEVAAVDRHDLPVAPPQWPVGPPAVLDEPRLADRHDLVTVDRLRPPARPGDDVDRPRDGEAPGARAHSSNGVSTARRSGTREAGATARPPRARASPGRRGAGAPRPPARPPRGPGGSPRADGRGAGPRRRQTARARARAGARSAPPPGPPPRPARAAAR